MSEIGWQREKARVSPTTRGDRKSVSAMGDRRDRGNPPSIIKTTQVYHNRYGLLHLMGKSHSAQVDQQKSSDNFPN